MNKKNIASLAIIIPLMFSHAAFADDEQTLVKDLSQQQLTEELTQDDLVASTEDYLLEQVERPQARRSALFAHILDTMAQNATMAKLDKFLITPKA